MKKFTLIAIIAIVFIFGISLYVKEEKGDNEETKIVSELEEVGGDKGERNFIFTVRNVGTEDVKLKFPSWLEYNFSVSHAKGDGKDNDRLKIEHLDLDEDRKEGRTLVLKTNDEIRYRIRLSQMPEGEYEMNVSSSSGYGGNQKLEFVIK